MPPTRAPAGRGNAATGRGQADLRQEVVGDSPPSTRERSLVEVEVDTGRELPALAIIGLLNAAGKGAKERVGEAVRRSG